MRDSIIIYRSLYNSLKALPPEMMKEAFTAICEYAMDEKEPPDDGIGRAMLEQCRMLIDRNNQLYTNGTKGGRPKKEDTEKPNHNQTVTKAEPNHNQTITNPEPNRNQMETNKDKGEKNKDIKNKDIKNIDIYINNKRESTKEKSGRFEPPTAPQVEQYCAENGYTNVDPQRFIDFYASKGWMVGANHMKDWKAAVRNWNRSQRQESTAKSKNRFNNFKQRDYDFTNLEKQLLGGQSS